ncbi:MAG TPA: hypothetical protein VFC16_09840 [Nakamurella sp.]|nr:hypothetical protein [Nakamurella sp.]
MEDLSRWEMLQGWLSSRASAMRWAIAARRRQLRGSTGAFTVGEVSDRAQHLTQMWDLRWGDSQPIGYRFRIDHPERWVRFHSLPDSKRFADNDEDYREILHRHRTVLEELLGGEPVDTLVVIGTDYGPRDGAAGQTRKQLVDAWPWRRHWSADYECWWYFWVKSATLTFGDLNDLLLGAADERADVIIADAQLSWIYHPYAGGADVILPSRVEADVLRDRHCDWLPEDSAGPACSASP